MKVGYYFHQHVDHVIAMDSETLFMFMMQDRIIRKSLHGLYRLDITFKNFPNESTIFVPQDTSDQIWTLRNVIKRSYNALLLR